MKVVVSYYASLREERGHGQETVNIEPISVSELYKQLNLTLPIEIIRFAVNNQFVPAGEMLSDGDRVAFIPPVAGG